jgi:hypothetical protein
MAKRQSLMVFCLVPNSRSREQSSKVRAATKGCMKHELLYGGGVQKIGRGTPQPLSLASIERFDTPILDKTPTTKAHIPSTP